MASVSKDVDLSKIIRRSECNCPICMSILIEPVTLPCNHELCMSCFRQHVEQTSLFCPICRIRISIWVRRSSRQNKLLNKKRWEEIKAAFPDVVKRRLEGDEDSSSEDNDFEGDYYVPNIAEPGELRREYEQEQKKLAGEWLHKHREEDEASLQLIAQIQQEEASKQEQERKDLELAVTLSKEMNGMTPEVTHKSSSSNISDTPKRQKLVKRTSSMVRQSSTKSRPNTTNTQLNQSPGTQAHLKMWFQAKHEESRNTEAISTEAMPSTSNTCMNPNVRTALLIDDITEQTLAMEDRKETLAIEDRKESTNAGLKGKSRSINKECQLGNSLLSAKKFSKTPTPKRLCLKPLN